jgi:hypothetical protein
MSAPAPPLSGSGAINWRVRLVCRIAPRVLIRSPRRTGEGLAQRVGTRLHGFHIAQITSLSRATVSRILRRLGLNRLRDLEPAVPLIRYEHAAPRDLLHLRY